MPECPYCAGEPEVFDSMDLLVDHLTDAHDVFSAVTGVTQPQSEL